MQLRTLTLALTAAGLFTACGGSGDPAPVAETSTTVTLTGVAARGAALAGAAVSAKCASGTGTATTSSSGSYSLAVAAGALPCVLKVTSSDSATVLHSVAVAGSSSTAATSNITPLTELLVAQLSATDPAAYMTSVAAAALGAAVTGTTVSTAQTAVVKTLTAAGVSTGSIGNMVTDTLVAATGSSSGNGYDLVLDALSDAITDAGTTLAALTTTVAAVAAGTSGTTPATYSSAASLPAELLLKPQASNCSALRSGSYRVVKLAPSLTTGASDAVTTTEIMNFDASTLTATWADGESTVWTGTGNCSYNVTGGNFEAFVSQAGVIVVRAHVGADDTSTSAPDTMRIVVMLPKQDIAVSELAGTWNVLSWDGHPAFAVNAGIATVASNGALSSAKCFDESLTLAEAGCATDSTALPVFSAHAGGGFNLTSTDTTEAWVDRGFAYRAGNGDLMVLLLNAQGEFSLLTKYRTLGLPAVGDVVSDWSLLVNTGNLAAFSVSAQQNTITALGSGSFTRTALNLDTGISVPQTITNNGPRNGYRYRPAASVTGSDGNPATVRETFSLPLAGMGFAAFYQSSNSTGSTSNARFGLSVTKP